MLFKLSRNIAIHATLNKNQASFIRYKFIPYKFWVDDILELWYFINAFRLFIYFKVTFTKC